MAARGRLKLVVASLAVAATAALVPALPGASASTTSTGVVAALYTKQDNLSRAISEIGRTPALISGFFGFVNPNGTASSFPTTFAKTVLSLGSTPMITWQPKLPTEDTTSVLTSISNGSLDSYLTTWAEAAKAENHKIYIRLMHEMNGAWYPWGRVQAGITELPDGTGKYPYTNTAAMYVGAFRHVVALFRSVGATNVEFVWCASTGASITNISSYYPGDAYVAWAAMDGYNRSGTAPRSFSTMFTPGYNALQAISSRPIMVAETASVEFSGLSTSPSSKAAWITAAYQSVPVQFPRIKCVEYFDSTGIDGASFSVTSSPSALRAIKQALASAPYRASAP